MWISICRYYILVYEYTYRPYIFIHTLLHICTRYGYEHWFSGFTWNDSSSGWRMFFNENNIKILCVRRLVFIWWEFIFYYYFCFWRESYECRLCLCVCVFSVYNKTYTYLYIVLHYRRAIRLRMWLCCVTVCLFVSAACEMKENKRHFFFCCCSTFECEKWEKKKEKTRQKGQMKCNFKEK